MHERPRVTIDDAGHAQVMPMLEGAHRSSRLRAEDAVDVDAEAALHERDVATV